MVGYDCDPNGLYQELETFSEREHIFGWINQGGIMWILDSLVTAPTTRRNIIEEFGIINYATILSWGQSYIRQPTRSAQDTNHMYHCVINFLSKEGKAKVKIWKKDYWIGDKPYGNLLLKVFIRESYLDTNSTTSGISSKLANLHNYLPTVGHDISLLNMNVKNQVYSLRARGEQTSDLLMNLFKAYAISSDKAFVRYIEKKIEAWEDRMLVVSPYQLMLWARQKFDLLKDKGVWNAPSEEEEKLVALQAEVAVIKKKFQDYRQNGGGGRGHGGPGKGGRGG